MPGKPSIPGRPGDPSLPRSPFTNTQQEAQLSQTGRAMLCAVENLLNTLCK